MIRFLASESQYARHLQPIAAQLGQQVERLDRRVRTQTDTLVVAAHRDLIRIESPSIVLVEHGAGQCYAGGGHPSYSGGTGRGRVSLFLTPSSTVAERNRRSYPSARHEVIGCPALDRWHARPATPEPDLAVISFHYEEPEWPEARGALRHYAADLWRVRDELVAQGIRLAGHSHPRIADQARGVYESIGMEWIASFDDVLDRAAVFAADNTSALPEFASTGRPVVWINAPWYRRTVNHGSRFWTWPQGQVQVDGPDGLPEGIVAALADPPEVRAAREHMVEGIYEVRDGTAAHRAAAAIAELSAESEAAA